MENNDYANKLDALIKTLQVLTETEIDWVTLIVDRTERLLRQSQNPDPLRPSS